MKAAFVAIWHFKIRSIGLVLLALLLMVGVPMALIRPLAAHADGGGVDVSGWLSTQVTPAVYTHMGQYDNYDPVSNSSDPACYIDDLSDPLNLNPTHTPFTTPFYQPGSPGSYYIFPILGDGETWASPAGQPSVPKITISDSLNPVSQALQVNSLALACQLQTTGVYFPQDIPLGFTSSNSISDWSPRATQIGYKNYTYVRDISVGAALNGTVTMDTSNPVVAGGVTYYPNQSLDLNLSHSSKYSIASPMPFTYTPPPGGFAVSGSVAAAGHAVGMHVATDGVHTYDQCIGDTTKTIYKDLSSAWIHYTLANTINGFCNSNIFTFSIPINYQAPNANCGTVTNVPASIAPGNSFTPSITMNNPSNGDLISYTSWGNLYNDGLSLTASGPGTPLGSPPYSSTQFLLMPGSDFTPPGDSATFMPVISAPLNPGGTNDTYTVNYNMTENGIAFGQNCSFSFKIRRVYDYDPVISLPGATHAGAPIGVTTNTGKLPASGSLVQPGDVLTIRETVFNRSVQPDPGDPYNWGMYVYTGPYTYPASLALGGDSLVSSGYDSAGVPSSGGTGATVEPDATYTVPNAPDGTQVCFFGYVSPAQRLSDTIMNPTPETRYSNAHVPTSPDGSAVAGYSAAGNVRSSLTNATSGDMCVEIERIRNLDIQVNQGDVHAGGGVGTSCTLAGGTGALTGVGGSGTYAQFIASADNAVNGFNSGGSGGTSGLTLGNNPTNGHYGVACRPDMNQAALTYIAAHGAQAWPATLNGSGLVNLTLLTTPGIYKTIGNVTLCGRVSSQVTIYAYQNNVTVGGSAVCGAFSNITYNPAAVAIGSLPSLGVIVDQGNILISKDTTQLDAFLVAQKDGAAGKGIINTCLNHTPGYTDDCNTSTLNILGSMIATSFTFGRSGGTCQTCNVVTETVTQSGLLYLAPPPAFATQPNTGATLPIYGGEGLPFY